MLHSLGGRSSADIVRVIPGFPPGLTPARAAWALTARLVRIARTISPPPVPTHPITPKSLTKMEDMLGEQANRYRISPESIEKIQDDFLEFFLEGISSSRVADSWRKKSNNSGCEFIVKFIASMSSRTASITSEETVELAMRAMLDAGLTAFGDVNHTNFLEFIGDYEDLNDVRTHPIDDASLAHGRQGKRLSSKYTSEVWITLCCTGSQMLYAPGMVHELPRLTPLHALDSKVDLTKEPRGFTA